VLAELGRLEDARRELRDNERLSSSLGLFQAEWYFSVFAVDFAARDWSAASTALDEAEQLARRESSRRNVSLLRGRLAFARAAYDDSLLHFERAAASRYQWQGGAAWLEHGDALAHLGRRDDARAAWRGCLERDGQSPASELARSRLSTQS
jgi:tetratricopeptide (TPR) repeat protein